MRASACKIMCTIFRDDEGVLIIDFIPQPYVTRHICDVICDLCDSSSWNSKILLTFDALGVMENGDV